MLLLLSSGSIVAATEQRSSRSRFRYDCSKLTTAVLVIINVACLLHLALLRTGVQANHDPA
jgi:hypothetical protein